VGWEREKRKVGRDGPARILERWLADGGVRERRGISQRRKNDAWEREKGNETNLRPWRWSRWVLQHCDETHEGGSILQRGAKGKEKAELTERSSQLQWTR